MAKVVPIRVIRPEEYNGRYILRGRIPFPEPDIKKWGQQFREECRRVAYTQISPKVSVSTVFLGLDHSFGDGPPVLFETLVFGGEHDGLMYRYRTWEAAEKGHKKACEIVREK